MSLNIEAANDARKKLLAFNADQIQSVTIVLGDQGLRLEVVLKPSSKWLPPQEFQGLPVTCS